MNPADGNTPVFSAAETLHERWRRARAPRIAPPPTAILCYQPGLMDYARRAFAVRRVDGFFGEVLALKPGGERLAVAGNFGVGAPAAVIVLEELAAFGVRRFISLGAAGSLQPGAAPGDWLVCDRALRDEGTSGHYAGNANFSLRHYVEHAYGLFVSAHGREYRQPGDASASQDACATYQRLRAGLKKHKRKLALSAELPWAEADPGMTAFLQAALAERGRPAASGPVWTTDAPYRETRAEAAACQQLGICAVDMEIAALFAAGRALGVQVGAALVLADRISPEGWRPPSDGILIRNRLRGLLEAVVAGLAQEGERS